MPVTEAKTKLQHIMESLKKLDAKTESGVNSSAAGPATPSKPSQEAALGELRARLKPFNLYFEWPEVQKLRAQLQLLDAEYLAGRETGRLLEEARQNLVLVEEKLTDQLVLPGQSARRTEHVFRSRQVFRRSQSAPAGKPHRSGANGAASAVPRARRGRAGLQTHGRPAQTHGVERGLGGRTYPERGGAAGSRGRSRRPAQLGQHSPPVALVPVATKPVRLRRSARPTQT